MSRRADNRLAAFSWGDALEEGRGVGDEMWQQTAAFQRLRPDQGRRRGWRLQAGTATEFNGLQAMIKRRMPG